MKLFYYSLLAYGLSILVWGAPAMAQDIASDDQATTYGQLANLVSQIAILKAQIQVVQLQKQIETAKAGGAVGVADEGAVPGLPNAPSAVKTLGSGFDRPEIVSISGLEGRLSAILLMPGGGEVRVVTGTSLGNGEFVRFVSSQSVQISQNGKIVALPFVGGSTIAPGG